MYQFSVKLESDTEYLIKSGSDISSTLIQVGHNPYNFILHYLIMQKRISDIFRRLLKIQ